MKTLFLVKCKSCGIDRVLPPKYKTKHTKDNWDTNFACYKLKFKDVVCGNPNHKFKEFELAGFNYDEILGNLLKKQNIKRLKTLNNEAKQLSDRKKER